MLCAICQDLRQSARFVILLPYSAGAFSKNGGEGVGIDEFVCLIAFPEAFM